MIRAKQVLVSTQTGKVNPLNYSVLMFKYQ